MRAERRRNAWADVSPELEQQAVRTHMPVMVRRFLNDYGWRMKNKAAESS